MNNQEIQNLIKELFLNCGFEVSVLDSTDIVNKDNSITKWFKLEMKDSYPFLNKEGYGLSAINHLLNRILEKRNSTEENIQNPKIVLDINNFQQKKIDSLHALAHMMAERARYFKSSVSLDPMSAFERRIVHEFLANESDIKTESAGLERERHVVIRFVG